MIFNPFAGIYNKHQELRSSLPKKIRDTFVVFWGNPLGIDAPPQWGLFDYFTFGIFVLNLHVLKAIVQHENTVLKLILSPIALLNIIAYLIVDLLPRIVISSILAIISIPLIVLVHVISNELKRWDVKKEIDALIQVSLDHDSNSLTIEDITINLEDWTETRTNYFIEQLNHNRRITKLTVNYSYADTELLLQFGLKLKHVTNLSIPKMGSIKIYPKLGQQPSEEVQKFLGDPSKNLFKFLMKNTTIDVLEIYDIEIFKRSIDKFNQQINQKEIKHLCKLSTTISPRKNMSKQINDNLEASVLLKSCFEFYKIMVTPWSAVRDNFGEINQEVTKLILLTLFQVCPKEILQKSKQGLIKSGFFSQQLELIGLDSQQEEASSNNVSNEI